MSGGRGPRYLALLPVLAACDPICGGDATPAAGGDKAVALAFGAVMLAATAALAWLVARNLRKAARGYDWSRSGPVARMVAVFTGAMAAVALVPAGYGVLLVSTAMAGLDTRNDVDCLRSFSILFFVVGAVSLAVARGLAGTTLALVGGRPWAPPVASMLLVGPGVFAAASLYDDYGLAAAAALMLIPLVLVGGLAYEWQARR